MGDYHEHQHQEMLSKEMMILKDLIPKVFLCYLKPSIVFRSNHPLSYSTLHMDIYILSFETTRDTIFIL